MDSDVVITSIDPGFDPGWFYFKNFTIEDVIREVLWLGGYRDAGPDGIHMAQIVGGLEVLAPFLADLFNCIIASSSHPDIWKKTLVKLIPK